jgi:hypothetical protein
MFGRLPSMKGGRLGYGLAAISLVAVALFGLSQVSHRVATPPTATPVPTSLASPDASSPPRLYGDLSGGRYTLAGAHNITIEAPRSGWAGYCCPGDPVIFNGQDLQAGFASLRYADATLMTLYLDPCHWSQSETLQPKGAAEIAAAMSELPGRSGTKPEAVTVAGRPAVHVRLSVPGDVNPGDCYGREYRTWNVGAGDPTNHYPGEIEDIYLVDLGLSTVAIDLSYFPGTSIADRRTLFTMLQSIRID